MSGDIKHLIYCDDEGDIRMVKVAKGVNPEDGSTDANGWTIRHYLTEIPNQAEWMKTHWWNGTTWVSRDSCPNGIAVWQDGEWTWDAEEFKNLVRQKRSRLLFDSDWGMLPDSPLTDEEKIEVQTYRTDLRNITNTTMPTTGILNDVSWPTKPACLG